VKHLIGFAAFLRAVLGHWLGFVITGGVGAVVTFVAELRGKSVPGWLWVVLAAVGLMYGCYKAFDDIRVERDKAVSAREAAELALTRKVEARSIQDTLGRFLEEGEALGDRIEASVLQRPMWHNLGDRAYTAMTETYSTKDWRPEVEQWSATVEAYLRIVLGAGYVNRFRSTAGLSPVGHVRFNYEEGLADVLGDLSFRITRIEQFMKEGLG
jgi:hypothetical protein